MLTPLGFSLLRQLSDGAFHSGEDLAATVGLTRARVSQLLKQAETAGLSLERVRGRGYRLLATPDFLDAAAVRSALKGIGVEVAHPDARPALLPAANDDDIALPISAQTGWSGGSTHAALPSRYPASVPASIRPRYLTHQCMESWSSPCVPCGPPPPLRRYILRA